MSCAGETAVVTGGTRGIGRAIARSFLDAGATVHATYAADDAAAEAFRDACGELAERLFLHRFDVADATAVAAFWEDLETRAPAGVQVLVNNAGIRRDAALALSDPADWERVIAVNLGACYHMCRHAVRNMMRQRYGRIVLVTSPAARFGFAGQTSYAASKAGQVGLMRSLCKEVASRGITVNCVSPGFVETDLIADLSAELRASYAAMVPLGRFARPEEVAWAVRCMAAREASYVTGTTLEVSGGL